MMAILETVDVLNHLKCNNRQLNKNPSVVSVCALFCSSADQFLPSAKYPQPEVSNPRDGWSCWKEEGEEGEGASEGRIKPSYMARLPALRLRWEPWGKLADRHELYRSNMALLLKSQNTKIFLICKIFYSQNVPRDSYMFIIINYIIIIIINIIIIILCLCYNAI